MCHTLWHRFMLKFDLCLNVRVKYIFGRLYYLRKKINDVGTDVKKKLHVTAHLPTFFATASRALLSWFPAEKSVDVVAQVYTDSCHCRFSKRLSSPPLSHACNTISSREERTDRYKSKSCREDERLFERNTTHWTFRALLRDAPHTRAADELQPLLERAKA